MSSHTVNDTKSEKTFSAYTLAQGQKYAEIRQDYDPSVYNCVIERHIATGGQLQTVLDIGCGPGNVARRLATQFSHAIGLDPSAGMISAARAIGGTTSRGEAIRFDVSTAEALVGVPDTSVDLIAAGNAAHWFDMTGFWHRAAAVLRPGGSVALWTSGDVRVHPSTPNVDALQKSLDQIQEEYLGPYMEPGNRIARGRYANLPLPWTVSLPVEVFDQATFYRRDWGPEETFSQHYQALDMDSLEKALGTGSPVTRWRQAHPQDMETERDAIRVMRRAIEKHLQQQGVEPGQERIGAAVLGTVLVVKRK